MITLRPYQEDIRNRIYQSMCNGHHSPLVVAPCGSGKTVVFCDLAERTQNKGNRVLILVHRIELLAQTVNTFVNSGITLSRIDVAMAQTCSLHLDRYKKPNLIITDEAHFSAANTWKKIFEYWPDVHVVGFSATPARLDGKPLGDIFDDLIIGIDTSELINTGYLAPYKYFAPTVADLSSLKMKGSDYNQDQAASLLMKAAVYGDVLKTYEEMARGKKTVLYASTIAHSKEVTEMFIGAGYRAGHIDGTTPMKQREDIIEQFRRGDIEILCNVDIVSVGFDLPDIECCIMLRPTASTALFIQQSGRALRPQPGKTAIILDHVGNYARHGLPDDLRSWSLTETVKPRTEYREDGLLRVRQCVECYFTFPTGPSVCPNCGAVIRTTREELKNIKEIRLEEIKQSRREHAEESVKKKEFDDLKTLQEFHAYAKLHGKSSKWAYFMWNQKCGRRRA